MEVGVSREIGVGRQDTGRKKPGHNAILPGMKRAPIIAGRIKSDHLRSSSSLWTLLRKAVERGALPACPAVTLLWWAAARCALRADDPPAAFVSLVVHRRWDLLSQADEDGARLELARVRGRLREREKRDPQAARDAAREAARAALGAGLTPETAGLVALATLQRHAETQPTELRHILATYRRE